MTDIERVARALAEHDGARCFEHPIGAASRRLAHHYEAAARAALQAMREPSPGMVEAGIRAAYVAMIPSEMARIHAAMIDKALEE